jgi:hypothetical protein
MSETDLFKSIDDEISIESCFQEEKQHPNKKKRISWTKSLHHEFLISVLKVGFKTVSKQYEKYEEIISSSEDTFENLKLYIDNVQIVHNEDQKDILHHKKNISKTNGKVEKDFQLVYNNDTELLKDNENEDFASDFENKFMTTLQTYVENANIDNILMPPIYKNDSNSERSNNNNNNIYIHKEEDDDYDYDEEEKNSNNFIERELENRNRNIHENEKESNDLVSRSYSLDDDFIDYLYNTS